MIADGDHNTGRGHILVLGPLRCNGLSSKGADTRRAGLCGIPPTKYCMPTFVRGHDHWATYYIKIAQPAQLPPKTVSNFVSKHPQGYAVDERTGKISAAIMIIEGFRFSSFSASPTNFAQIK